jgi:hypothetical protein
MQELRANTQIRVKIGPVVAVGDGFTPVTSLDLSTADEAELLKHDSTSVTDISGATFAAITSADGYYNLTLTTSHTDTEGLLDILINDDSLCLPIRHRLMVLSEAAWDSKYVAKDDGFMDVNIKTIGRADTQETEASNLEAACAAYLATRGLAGTALPNAAADAAGGLVISDAGGLDLDNRMPAATSVTNMNTVFNTDFATAYNTTTDGWNINVTHIGGDAQSMTDLKDFADAGYDPSTNKVQGVVLVDTTTDLTNAPASVATAAELAKVPKSDSNVTWNATALASINTQADAALADYDGPTKTEMDAAFTEIKGATWASTDSLEAIRDRGDAAWITETGFSTHSAADVWAVATRTLSAFSFSVTVGTNNDKTGYALSATGLDAVVPADPSTIPVLGTSSIVAWIGFFGAWSANEVNSDSDSVNLRNSADNADLATYAVSDNGTTFSSGEPS